MNTNTNLNSAISFAENLLEKGYTKAKIEAYLTLEDYSKATIKEALKSLNIGSKARTFASDYYEYLSTEVRTQSEASAYILGTGEYGETSQNVKKHLSHYLNIWELTVAIWNTKGETKEEEETEADSPEVKAAWAKLKKAKADYESGKNVRKATVHPDKVSSFGNAELTNAYKEFFQILNK